MDDSLGVRRIWWLLQCSHLMVPLCIAVSPVGVRLTAVCGAALCPSCFAACVPPNLALFFFCWRTRRCQCALPGGLRVAPYLRPSGVPTVIWVTLGAPGTSAHVSKSANRLNIGVYWVLCGGCDALLLLCILAPGCPRLGVRDSCESTPCLVVCSDHQWFGRCVS